MSRLSHVAGETSISKMRQMDTYIYL